MRKINFTILILIIIIPIKVSALSTNLSINCPSSTQINENITCTLSVNASNGGISGINGSINYSNAQLVSFTRSSIWQGSPNGNAFAFYTNSPKYQNISIGTVILKPTADTVKLTLTVNEYSDENDDLVSGSTKTATIRVVNNTQNNNSSSNNQINNSNSTTNNNNNTVNNNKPNYNKPNNNEGTTTTPKDTSLKKLIINNKEVTISNPIIFYVSYKDDKLDLKYELNDPSCVVKLDKESATLKEGENKFNLIITGDDQTTTNYEINVIRRSKKVYVDNKKEEILNLLNDDTVDKIYLKLDLKEKHYLAKEVLNALKTSKKTIIAEFYNNKNKVYELIISNGYKNNYEQDLFLNLNFQTNNKNLNKLLKNKPYLYFYNNENVFPDNIKIIFNVKNLFQKNILIYNYEGKKLNEIGKIDLKNDLLEIDLDLLNDFVYTNYESKENQGLIIILLSIIGLLITSIVIYMVYRKRK